MQLIVQPDGMIRCLYTERIDLSALGSQQIRRASCLEPTEGGLGQVDFARGRDAIHHRGSCAAPCVSVNSIPFGVALALCDGLRRLCERRAERAGPCFIERAVRS